MFKILTPNTRVLLIYLEIYLTTLYLGIQRVKFLLGAE
jgi:hypothetical protein